VEWIVFVSILPGPPGWLSATSVLGLGLVLGMKHALDADHLAAVSTMISEDNSVRRSSLIGVLWGGGHTLALLAAGVLVIIGDVRIGERTALAFEFAVALMLIVLGVNALWKVCRGGTVHMHVHRHGGRVHVHPHLHGADPDPDPHTHHGVSPGARPFVVGIVHGLAGSAALMLLVLSTISSRLLGLAFIVIFGIGSIGGMLLMSVVLAVPLQAAAARFGRADRAIRLAAGMYSLGFGLFLAYRIGVESRLLL